jgi:hypothetical protein
MKANELLSTESEAVKAAHLIKEALDKLREEDLIKLLRGLENKCF